MGGPFVIHGAFSLDNILYSFYLTFICISYKKCNLQSYSLLRGHIMFFNSYKGLEKKGWKLYAIFYCCKSSCYPKFYVHLKVVAYGHVRSLVRFIQLHSIIARSHNFKERWFCCARGLMERGLGGRLHPFFSGFLSDHEP